MQTEQRSSFPKQQNGATSKLATALGWFSIGVGAAELLAPDRVAQLVGLPSERKREALLTAYGWREIAAGIGILTKSQPSGWLWARVAGDAVDLGSLGSCFTANDADRTRVTASTIAVAGVTALDVVCALQMSRNGVQNGSATRTVHITQSVIVDRSAEDIYDFWRDCTNMPKIMRRLEEVQRTGQRTFHWKLNGPGGRIIEWNSEVTEEQPNRRIAWRTIHESTGLQHSGSINLKPATGARGTIVRIDLEYAPPGGQLAAKVVKLLRAAPAHYLGNALRAFKSLMETGEVVESDASVLPGAHPGRPLTSEELASV